ncbi:transcriptional regulator [Siphonobacter sp. BAB-5405]|uniref:helix-turn-helix domain-containing protein n=1 Tax=Siphonobacter sp. BAB-5405 TaxID=1864825 RepID=UPI000C80B0F0|nr:AraC family transcriptional regulator [Siphonobacter sp. BAB-5405]PMD92405.1 transcriptional regulator [Siphonobacter sp. BAB-5405]
MSTHGLTYQLRKPDGPLSTFVEGFWMLEQSSEQKLPVIVVPDGRVDILFSKTSTGTIQAMLRGLDTEPGKGDLSPGTRMFAVSLNLLAVEYVLGESVAALLNTGRLLPAGFWEIQPEDLLDFTAFCSRVSEFIERRIHPNPDTRKRQLFELLYESRGDLSVEELARRVTWNRRQINRYFTQWFGLPLKTYSTILRFRASFEHLRQGKLFPEENFTDQAHFIREVKKFAGVVPKELSKNVEDRFIQFSTLPAV